MLIMVIYYYISVIGIQKIEAKISIDKMALPDSYLQGFQHVFEEALRNMQPITVFIMNPGDLRDPNRLNGYSLNYSPFIHRYKLNAKMLNLNQIYLYSFRH